MTKRKSLIVKLLLALIVLTLISFCFLGNTFARYTSNNTGTATVQVAKWEIDVENAETEGDSTSVSFSKLSPSMAEKGDTVEDEYVARSNASAPILVATIANKSDVAANLTFNVDAAPEIWKSTGAMNVTTADEANPYTTAAVQALFGITLYYSTSDGAATSTNGLTEFDETVTLAAQDATTGNKKIYLYAVVTWTSSEKSDSDITAADKLDTWVGENVEKIVYTISYTAVQASTVPATDNP